MEVDITAELTRLEREEAEKKDDQFGVEDDTLLDDSGYWEYWRERCGGRVDWMLIDCPKDEGCEVKAQEI